MTHNALQIATGAAGPELTPQQKRFNTLIRQIEQVRQTLKAWDDGIAEYRQAHVRLLLPLETELLAERRRWVIALDVLLDQARWTKAERETLVELLCDASAELLQARGDDQEIKALFDKHAEVDFDTEQRKIARTMKDMAQAMTGMDLGDDEGIHTDADLFERVQQAQRERAAADEAEREAKAASRRKTAAQQRREAQAQQVTQSVREIFRKLASALHPDRETDAAQRTIKTELMQQVNQAYSANDLLALLELQLKIEQIDASHIASASAQRLKHYNQVLAEQLSQLRWQVDRVAMQFQMDFGFEPMWTMNPRRLGQLLEKSSRQLRAELNQQQRDMRMLGDVPATRRWLKRQRQLLLESESEFDIELF